MSVKLRLVFVRTAIFVTTCFGVFVLPFLLSAPYFKGLSASNLAGFNNKVAVVSAACIAVVVFFVGLKWPQILGVDEHVTAAGMESETGQRSRLPTGLVAAVVLLWGAAILSFGTAILRMGVTYADDWGYFINRASAHADFGRQLYSQMQFYYGPLILYGPIAVRFALTPFHASLSLSYLITLTVETMIGLVLVAYVIDHLPMSRRWKAVIFLLLAAAMVVGNMGTNYTFFRFATPMAFLVMASRRKQPWAAALWIFVGEAVCLGLSPEIGIAFAAGSFGFALYRLCTEGRWWIPGTAAPIVSTAFFLVLVGKPYLDMVRMFARGMLNFPVEPLPHILLFLFAFVWLVPTMISRYFRENRVEAPVLAAIFVVSLTLLPAAFGRADPTHVFWNGWGVFLLSIVAISSKRRWQQIAWGSCIAIVFLWMINLNRLMFWSELQPVLHTMRVSFGDAVEGRRPARVQVDDPEFDLHRLQEIVGHDPVATPVVLPLQVENSLRSSGQYSPSFYYAAVGILDAAAEDRQIREFNQSKWALIPAGSGYASAEQPDNLKYALGFQLPYRTRRPVYAVEIKFDDNLKANWRMRGRIGRYILYEHV